MSTEMTVPQDLIERVKAATGPDRELDEAISSALCDEHFFAQLADAPEGTGCEMYRFGPHSAHSALRVTASIDAALALAERVLPGCVWTIEADACWLRVLTKDDVAEFQGNKTGMGGKWTPIAIVLATLLALQSSEQSK